MISTVASWEGYFQFASQVLRQKVMICQQDKKKEGNRINISEALRYFGKTMIFLTAEAPAVALRQAQGYVATSRERRERFSFSFQTGDLLGRNPCGISFYP